MDSLKYFPFPHSKDFKLEHPLSDENLQDLCTTIRNRIQRLTSNSPKVSVVFPAYNEEMYLPLMLWTLSQLATQVPIEIIGVDNASSDRTWEIMSQSGVIRVDEKRKWVSYARQAWLEASKWEIIATTDSDTQVPLMWIDTNLQYFSLNPDIVCLSAWVEFFKPHVSYYFVYQAYKLLQRVLALRSWDTVKQPTESWAWANTFFKKEIAIASGGYTWGDNAWGDNRIARAMQLYWKIATVSNDLNARVTSSSRRWATFEMILKHTKDRILHLWIQYHSQWKLPLKDIR